MNFFKYSKTHLIANGCDFLVGEIRHLLISEKPSFTTDTIIFSGEWAKAIFILTFIYHTLTFPYLENVRRPSCKPPHIGREERKGGFLLNKKEGDMKRR